jgi:hypothetical protein
MAPLLHRVTLVHFFTIQITLILLDFLALLSHIYLSLLVV